MDYELWNGTLAAWIGEADGNGGTVWALLDGVDLATPEGVAALGTALRKAQQETGATLYGKPVYPPVRREAITALETAARKPIRFTRGALGQLADSAPQTALDWDHDQRYGGQVPSQGVTLSSRTVMVSRPNGDEVGLLDVQEITGAHALAEMAKGVAVGGSLWWGHREAGDAMACELDGSAIEYGVCSSSAKHYLGQRYGGRIARAVVSSAYRVNTALTSAPAMNTRLGVLSSIEPQADAATLACLSTREPMAENAGNTPNPTNPPAQSGDTDTLSSRPATPKQPERTPAGDDPTVLRQALDTLRAEVTRQSGVIETLRAEQAQTAARENDRIARETGQKRRINGDADALSKLRAEHPDYFDRVLSLVELREGGSPVPPTGGDPPNRSRNAMTVMEQADALSAAEGIPWTEAYTRLSHQGPIAPVNLHSEDRR